MIIAFLIAGGGAALAYWAVVRWPPSLGRSALKTAALGLPLLGLAQAGWPLVALLGLAACVLGDLALSRPGERALKAGIGAFALGHIAYVAAMVQAGDLILPATALPLVGCAALVALGLSTRRWLLPYAGALRPAVAIYVALILLMGITAFLRQPISPWLIAGALSFVFSDLILAIELFRLGETRWKALTARLVWPLYIAGQAGLMAGLGPLG
jgi:uncharacterized membrane protein YhhN